MSAVRFKSGRLMQTPGAQDALAAAGEHQVTYLTRHLNGDWGDVDAEDKETNDRATRNGTRILSAYKLPKTGVKVWLITEADRSLTTFLLPDEY